MGDEWARIWIVGYVDCVQRSMHFEIKMGMRSGEHALHGQECSFGGHVAEG
jgi:hypothetical protein